VSRRRRVGHGAPHHRGAGRVPLEGVLVEDDPEARPLGHAHLAARVVEGLPHEVVFQHHVSEELHGVAEHRGARRAELHLGGGGDPERLVVQDGPDPAPRGVVDRAQRQRDPARTLAVHAHTRPSSSSSAVR
jgi:hypothetical protein